MRLMLKYLVFVAFLNSCRACSVCYPPLGPSFLVLPRMTHPNDPTSVLKPLLERRQNAHRDVPFMKTHFLPSDGSTGDAETEEKAPSKDDDKESSFQEPMSAAMIATIGVYKEFISPLLPPACRFLPTCSQYGVQAIQEFGPTKGSLLTAWRLLRCSPIGGKGYDPPKWPPVAYWYSSY